MLVIACSSIFLIAISEFLSHNFNICLLLLGPRVSSVVSWNLHGSLCAKSMRIMFWAFWVPLVRSACPLHPVDSVGVFTGTWPCWAQAHVPTASGAGPSISPGSRATLLGPVLCAPPGPQAGSGAVCKFAGCGGPHPHVGCFPCCPSSVWPFSQNLRAPWPCTVVPFLSWSMSGPDSGTVDTK